MPGTPYAYQKLYTQLYGTLLLFLQKRDLACTPTPLDCVLVTMTPGTTVLIPPDYAHVLINPTAAPALMAGLYCPNFQPDYSEVKRQRGLAYYILAGDDDIQIEPNPSYNHAPALQRLDDVSGTHFDPGFSKGLPLWTAFMQSPQDYTYLSQAEAACTFFERS